MLITVCMIVKKKNQKRIKIITSSRVHFCNVCDITLLTVIKRHTTLIKCVSYHVRPRQPLNTSLLPSGSKDFSSLHPKDNFVINFITLRMRMRGVYRQLERLRLLPTAQVMKAADALGLNTTSLSPTQFRNAMLPISVRVPGSVKKRRPLQSSNA